MIIDDKFIMLPPPPYHSSRSSSSYGGSTHTLTSLPLPLPPNSKPTLTSLPPHILLQIIHHTFPQGKPQLPSYNPHDRYDTAYYEDTKPERQRKTLFWLSTSLRLVSRQLYIASMHVLRSTYLPAYEALIRPGYSSDPFPMGVPAAAAASSPNSPTSNANAPSTPTLTGAPPAYESPSPSSSPYTYTPDTSPLLTPHRETPVLDRFILLKVRQDVFADESELHMDREDAFRDLFDVAQPRARLEDLVRIYGVREGVVSVPGWDGQAGGQTPRRMYAASSEGSRSSSSVLSLGLELLGEPLSPSPSFSSTTSAPAKPSAPAPSPSPKPTSTWRSFFKKPSSPASSSGASSPRTPSSPSPSSPSSATPNTKPNANTKTPSKGLPIHPPHRHPPKHPPLPFPSLSISFSPRRIGLVLNRGRTIAEVPRVPGRKEPLEVLAWGLVRELKAVLGAS